MTPEVEYTLSDTIDDMLSEEPEKQLGAELMQCQIRLKNLYITIGNIAAGNVEIPSTIQTLTDQARMLEAYISILTKRMADYAVTEEVVEDA